MTHRTKGTIGAVLACKVVVSLRRDGVDAVGGSRVSTRTGTARRVGFATLLVALVCFTALARAEEPTPEPEAAGRAPEHDAAEIGAKLSNPVSNLWALFTEIDLDFADGNVNQGNPKVGGAMIFQPIMPFPLYGSGEHQWKLITRPTIPIVFSAPIPTGVDEFANLGGLGDIKVPMLLSPPTGNWILGAGVDWLFPTSNHDALGQEQWGVGPTAVFGYKNKQMVAGVFPQYYFGFASRSDRPSNIPDTSQLNLLYFAFYNLPDAWQIGFNPTITFDDRASSGNKWNVPIGLVATKTTFFGRLPVKFQFGIEYSVVSQNDFGQRAQFKINVIPVIPSLVQNSIFGGG
jgi:hypothetical protein